MTDQICNQSLFFDGNAYELLESRPGVFSPWDYGIEPEAVESSNWSGFQVFFSVQNGQLLLDCLVVGYIPPKPVITQPDPIAELDRLLGPKQPLPALNSVQPVKMSGCYWSYDNVNLALDYTGALVVGDDNRLLELTFKEGQLLSSGVEKARARDPEASSNGLLPEDGLDPWEPVSGDAGTWEPAAWEPADIGSLDTADLDVPEEILAQIIGNCRPESILCCGHTAEAVARLWHNSHPEAHLLVLDKQAPNDSFPLDFVPDLALLSDTLEQLPAEQGALLLGQLRNYGSHQIAVLVHDNAGWQLTDFTGLGFRRHTRLRTASGPATLYSYNLDSYNHKRSWNNPDHWANPEMWGKAWW